MRLTLWSLAALPASSSTSAVRYPMMAACTRRHPADALLLGSAELEVTVDTSDGELQSSARAAGLCGLLRGVGLSRPFPPFPPLPFPDMVLCLLGWGGVGWCGVCGVSE